MFFFLQAASLNLNAQALAPGTISLTGTNPVCKGNDPGIIISTVDATPTGEITYQWQIESTPGNWVNLPATGNSYDPGVLMATTSYRRVAIYTLDNSLTAISNVITIVVTDVGTPLANPTQTFCTITNPTTASLSATGSTLKWYNVSTGGTPLASNTTLTSGTYYVSQTINGCEGPRTAVTATVYQTPVVTANPLTQTLCTGSLTNIALTSNVTGTTFSWTVAQSNLTGATAGSGTSINQVLSTTGAVQGTATYTITPVANGCSGTPVQVVISVNTKPQVTAQVNPSAVTICTYETATFNVGVAGAPQPSIQWQESPDGSSWSNIAGATSNTYSFTAYANQKGFRYRTVLNNSCGTVISSEGLLDVSPPIGIKTQPTGTAVCNGNTASFFAEVNGQQTFTTTTWQISRDGGLTWINVDPANVTTLSTGAENGVFQTTFAFNPTLADNGAKVRVVFTNNCPVYSNVVDLAVVALPANPVVSNANRCGPGSVTLIAQPPSGSTVDWYEVASGGSPVATGTNTFTTPNLSTTTTYYAVSRTLVSGCLSARVPVTATIKDIPTASVNNLTICNGSSAILSVTTNATSPAYNWSPVTAITPSITVSPNTSTSYTVTVTDGITFCQIAATGTVYVNPTPSAPTAPSPVLYCMNSTAVALTANGAGGNQLRWYTTATGGTALPSAPIPSTTSSGSFSYWVSQVNNSNCEGPRTKVDVIVNPLPVVTVSPSVAICSGFNTTLTASGAVSYSWSPSTDLSSTTGNTVVADPTSTTTYTVTGTDVNGCKSSANTTVTVNPLPTVSVNNPTICLGSSATLTATTNALSPGFSWNPGSATTSNITVTPATSSNYTVTVTDGNTGCIKTATGIVTINPPATANAGTPQTICAGDLISLSGFASGSATWSTSGSGNFSPNSAKLDAVYTPGASDIASGSVILTLTAADPDGAGPCSAVASPVVMTINPLATVNAGPNQTVCAGTTITLAGSIGGGATSATWSAPSGTFSDPNALNATYTPSITNGSVILTLTSNDPAGPCGPATATMVINVNPKPVVNVSVSTLCSGSNATIKATPAAGTVTDYNYSWTVPSGFTNPGNVNTFSSSTIGTYTVVITSKATNCPSLPVSGTLTSNPLLGDPIVTNGSRCGAGPVVLSATADVNEVVDWYANSSTTTKLATAFTYTTGNLSAPSVTTYWVEARHSTLGCKSARVPVTATVYAIPPAPTPINASICGPGSVTLSASGCTGGTYNWYSASTGGTLLYTGNSYTTTVSATTSFWVSCTSADNCEGPRAEVIATVNPITPGTIGTNQVKCSGADPDVLTNIASGTGGVGSAITYQWESSVNGGAWTPIPGATGLTYDPPAGITAATSYRRVITSIKNGAGGYNCSLPSNVVIVNVNPLPSIVPSPIPNICFGTTSATLSYTSAANGGDLYSISWNASAISAGFTNVVNATLTPGQINITVPAGASATTYTGNLTISNSNTGCVSAVYPISITINPLPVCSISGNNNICPGSTNTYTAPPGMSSYSWSISGNGTINGSTISGSVSVLSGSICGAFTLTLTITNANGCTSTCSSSFTVFDNVKPTVTGTATIPSLGCNPPDPTTAFIAPTATDNCNTPVLKTGYPVTSSVSSSGCTNTQTRTWIFVDACGNESLPFVQTITWTADNIKPLVTGVTNIPDLGCNPPNPTAAFVAPTASDNCGIPVLKFGYPITSTVTITGCSNSQTRTWIFVDACGNESDPFVQTITWKTDLTKPVVTGIAAIPDLGCNPPNPLAAFVAPTATDNCGIPVLKAGYPITSSVTTSGCDNTQTRTWIFVDACGNESTPFVQTITWTADVTKPVLTGNTTIPSLGCNPPNPSSSFVAPVVTDNCGSISLKTGYPITSPVSTVNCNNTQTRIWIYIDGCGNESDPFTQTITWTSDQVKPVVTGLSTIPNLGCNPADPTAAFVAPSVSDNCGVPVLKSGYPITSPVSSVNCVSTQTRTWIYVDACGNESDPFMQTVIWTSDQTKPVLTCPAPQVFCINPNNSYTIPVITATDNCSNVTVQYTITGATTRSGTGTDASGIFNVGISTIQWTVTDGCNNSITCSITVTVNAETLPAFNAIAPICIGSTPAALPATSTNGINGTWSPSVINTSIPGLTTYTFTPTAGQCASKATMNITILAKDIPVFDPIGPLCKGTPAPTLPSVSKNGIAGTWDKTLSTAIAGKITYTFTPATGLCAATATMDITITDPVIPAFDPVGPFCKNAVAPALPLKSKNNINGTWDKTINTSVVGKSTYTFTPTPGQCALPTAIEIEIADQVVPTFTQPGPYCIGSTPNALPATSLNGIKGSWSPSSVSTAASGIAAYTFTPDADQCGIPVTLSIEVTEKTIPVFDPVGPYCQGTTVFPLPLKSKNNITGTWNKALSTAVAGKTTYVFTPNAGQCATSTSIEVQIDAPVTPVFDPIGPYCLDASVPMLPSLSKNGIPGTWDKIISTSSVGKTTYSFTPAAGQCATSTTIEIEVTSKTIPLFDPVGPFCNGSAAPALPSGSKNGIAGTWDKMISTSAVGKTIYTFTPAANQCATTATLEVEITGLITPVFDPVGPYCLNTSVALLPAVSKNGIAGTWDKVISTSAAGKTTYTFTPAANQCAIIATVEVEIADQVTPTFAIGGPYCIGSTAPALPATSLNGIKGTWSPASVSTATAGTKTYTFTPDPGFCGVLVSVDIQINNLTTPVFDPVGPYCKGAAVIALPTKSKNNIIGTWDKVLTSASAGKTTYTFTPAAGQCATTATLEVEVTDLLIPVFDPVGPFCKGNAATALPLTSKNNITGSWDKAINTSLVGKTIYTFTPDAGQCAINATIEVEVTDLITPVFDPVGPYCLNANAPVLPTISKNNITGSWNKTISTASAGKTVYTFTPDPNQCALPATVEVEIADQVTPTFTPVGPFCKGATTNALPQTSLNGIKGSWDKTINTSVAGTSTYTFTPDPGQCGIAATIDIVVTDPVVPIFDPVGPYCKGASAAALPLKSKNNITGTWDKAINTSLIGKTIYTFTPDANQCAVLSTLEVEVADQVTPVFDPIGPYCKDAPAAALPTTSKNNIKGSWNKSVNTSVIGTATYTFTPDAGQCGSAVTIDIEITDKITPLFDPVGPYCKNASAAALPLTSKNNITGTWDKAINTSLIGKTIYTFTPDANQCSLPTTLEVEIADQVIPVFDPIGPYCKDASAAALPTTSKNNIKGSWNASVNTSVVGTVTYTFTPDAGQCGSPVTIDIEITDKIVPLFDQVGPYCKGSAPGTLPVKSKNNITGTWDKTINTSLIGKTIYTFTPDPNQCAVPSTLEVEITDQIIPDFDPIAPYCKGAAPGPLPARSKNNITGTWDRSVTTGSIGITTYTFTPDAGQCAIPVTIDIETQNCCTVELTAVATPITCTQSNGTITATASKGVPPYLYAIDNGAFQGNNNFITKAGTFRIQVKDANDCVAETTVTVDEIVSNLAATALAPDIPCDKTTGTITVQAMNGLAPYTYGLNGGGFQNADSFTDLVAGDYNITIKDAFGCTTSIAAKLNKIGNPPNLIINDPASVCAPNTIDITDPKITNGSDAGVSFSYWKDAGSSIPVADPSNINLSGIYFVKAENAAGCSSIKPVIISVADRPLLKITNPIPSCTAADITSALVTAGSGNDLAFTYWEDALATTSLAGPATINKTGTYFIKGTAPGGCFAIEPVNVTILNLPSLIVNAPTAVCAPSTIDITSAAITNGSDPGLGLSYWQDLNATIPIANPNAIKASGTYYIKAVSKDGCVAIKAADVVVNSFPILTVKDPAAVCLPSAIDLTDPTITAGSESGLTFSYWSDAAATQQISSINNITASGTYYIKATLATGCFDIKPVKTDIRPLPVMALNPPPAICAPGSIDLTNPAIVKGSDNGLTYSYWSDANCTKVISTPTTMAQSGTYYIKSTAGSGCSVVRAVDLTINPAPRLFVNDPPDVCTPNTVDITASSITAGSDASLTYSYWKDALTTQPLNNPNVISTSGTYTLKAVNTFGCVTTKAVNVVINDLPTIIMKAPDSLCIGLSTNITIGLSGQAPWSFQFSDGRQTYFVNNITSQPYQLNVTPTETTIYTISSVSDRYCTNRNPDNNKAKIHITRPIPGVRLKSVNTTAFTNTTLHARDIPSYTYDWQPKKGLNTYSSPSPVFNYGKQSEYQIKMVSSAGCVTIDSITVRVANQVDPDAPCDFFIPNVFSPNGDGRNDTYFPFTINIKEIRFFRIFNRWGELVFETKAFGEGWNGMYKGKLQPTDVFVWTAEAVCNDGTVIRKSGNVLLLK
jgi:gliding motility-associated-like protein